MHRSLARAALAASLLTVAACNRHVFRLVEQSCDSTIPVDRQIPTERAADILVVVDNSGSMQDEQDRLAANFVNPNPAECPLQGDLRQIPAEFQNPTPDLYEAGGPLSQCGFIQLLAAFDNDFRVGVITTDTGPCDNRFDTAPAGWGHRPQRGCLQPDAPTRDGVGVGFVIARADLASDDAGTRDLAGRFRRTLDNIKTNGSSFERGLDATEIFLDEGSARAPACTDDLAKFRRPGANLVVILVSDENDCSHGDGAYGFADDNADIRCDDAPPNHARSVIDDASRCYSDGAHLAPVQRYVDALHAHDAGAKVAVIAGMLPDSAADGGFDAAGCLAATGGGAPTGDCWPSEGSSNFTAPGQICGDTPDPTDLRTAQRAGAPCCVADAGSRYLDFARSFADSRSKSFLADSICNESFRQTMIQVAAFIAATTSIDLVEAPKDGLVTVSVTHPGQGAPVVLDRLAAADCAARSGWYLDGDRRIVFCNDAIPGPGDEVQIRAKGQANTAACSAGG